MLESIQKTALLLKPFDRVSFYCVDPGAFNIMYPIYSELKDNGMEACFILEGWCKTNKGNEVKFITWDYFAAGIAGIKAADKKNVCVVLGSQTDFHATHQALRFCRDNLIFSFFIFDHWINYLQHFYDSNKRQLHLPDKICLMDEVARDALIRELYPFLVNKAYINDIDIIGHPAIEKSVLSIKRISDKDILRVREKVGGGNRKIILFLLEPIEDDFGYGSDGQPALGYTEYTMLKYFFAGIRNKNIKVIVRPHPRQDLAKLENFLSEDINNEKNDYILMENENLDDLIAAADEVVGITTVALIIALKAGKKVTSLQVGRNEEGRRMSNEYLEKILVI